MNWNITRFYMKSNAFPFLTRVQNNKELLFHNVDIPLSNNLPPLTHCDLGLQYRCLSGKLWYVQHKCVGDTIVYHKDSDKISCISFDISLAHSWKNVHFSPKTATGTLDDIKTFLRKSESEYKTFLSRKCHWKRHLHNTQASVSWGKHARVLVVPLWNLINTD